MWYSHAKSERARLPAVWINTNTSGYLAYNHKQQFNFFLDKALAHTLHAKEEQVEEEEKENWANAKNYILKLFFFR